MLKIIFFLLTVFIIYRVIKFLSKVFTIYSNVKNQQFGQQAGGGNSFQQQQKKEGETTIHYQDKNKDNKNATSDKCPDDEEYIDFDEVKE